MSGIMFSFKGGVLVVRHKASRQIVFHVKIETYVKAGNDTFFLYNAVFVAHT